MFKSKQDGTDQVLNEIDKKLLLLSEQFLDVKINQRAMLEKMSIIDLHTERIDNITRDMNNAHEKIRVLEKKDESIRQEIQKEQAHCEARKLLPVYQQNFAMIKWFGAALIGAIITIIIKLYF
jgi:hypothetical protein